MSEHPNAAIVRRLYEAFEAGDFDVIRGLFHEDAQWHAAGRNWLVGDYHGKGAVLDLLAMIAEFGEGNYQVEVWDVVANDRVGIGLHRSTVVRPSDGRTMSVDDVLIFGIEDGKIRNVWATPWDQYEEDEFYGAEAPDGFSAPASRAAPDARSWTPRPATIEPVAQ